MKPPPFGYSRPDSVAEAVSVLASTGPDGKVLAGGQSLVPLLNMRLATPEHLVDINRLTELAYVSVAGGQVRIGALARHAQVLADPVVEAAQPLITQALRLVAHPVIRNRGTTVGSIVHADPSGEMTAVLALLGGTVLLASTGGERSVAAENFFLGPLESDVRPDELATQVSLPVLAARAGCAFAEVSRRNGDYAVCGVAAVVELDDEGGIGRARKRRSRRGRPAGDGARLAGFRHPRHRRLPQAPGRGADRAGAGRRARAREGAVRWLAPVIRAVSRNPRPRCSTSA